MEFWKLLDLTITGLNTGILYGLVAIGYTMVYGIIKLINFAHGEVCMLGIMVTYTLVAAVAGTDAATIGVVPFLVFVLIAAVFDGGLGIALDHVAYKPLRGASRLSALITAIGMSLLLQNLAVLIWDPQAKTLAYSAWFDENAFTIGEMIPISRLKIIIWISTLVSMVGLYAVVMKTKLGTAMRACSQNSTAAALMGIRLDRVVAVTFFIGSLFAAFAGIAVAMNKGSFDYQIGLYIGLVAFAAAVLGGIGNIPGAMLGGVIIGVAESLAAGYMDAIPHPARLISAEYAELNFSVGYKEGVAFVVLILILLFRPQGLLGSKGGDRA
jgi:branched-chain amino acid transport system permease protein